MFLQCFCIDHHVPLFPMVANYRSSDAVFAEGLNNKEDVNDKVNKRVDGRIMDPFKEVLNLLWGISSISFPWQGTNEDEWEEGRKDKQTYLGISTQIKCALVVNSCTTLSIQRLRRIKLYFLLFNLLSSSTFCRISYCWELWQIRLPERRSESGSSFWRSRIFFCATLSRAIVHPEPVVSVLHRVIIRTMSIFCHIFYGFKIDGKADWRAGQVLNLCKFDDISEWKALKISHSSKSWISKWNFFFVHRRCIPTAESIVSLCSLGSNDQLTLLQQVTGPWEKAALFSHYFHFPQMRPSEI